MGKIITFWSPYHGQCKTTATAVALASTRTNAILTHIQPKMSNMEAMFGLTDEDEKSVLNDNGFNSLIYTAMSKPITKEDIETTVIQISDNLAILPSTGRNKNDSTRNTLVEYILTEVLPKYYQNVFIDLGTESSECAKNIQKKADVNVIVLPQNRGLWKKYNQTENDRYILAGYDKDSKFTKKAFQMAVSRRVDTIPYCIEYADAISGHDVQNFFLRNEKILDNPNKRDELYNFFQDLKEVKI